MRQKKVFLAFIYALFAMGLTAGNAVSEVSTKGNLLIFDAMSASAVSVEIGQISKKHTFLESRSFEELQKNVFLMAAFEGKEAIREIYPVIAKCEDVRISRFFIQSKNRGLFFIPMALAVGTLDSYFYTAMNGEIVSRSVSGSVVFGLSRLLKIIEERKEISLIGKTVLIEVSMMNSSDYASFTVDDLLFSLKHIYENGGVAIVEFINGPELPEEWLRIQHGRGIPVTVPEVQGDGITTSTGNGLRK